MRFRSLRFALRLIPFSLIVLAEGATALFKDHDDRLLAGHLSYLDVRRNPAHRQHLRRALGFRLLRGEAETLTFDRDDLRWTVPVNDRFISLWLFETGGFQDAELKALLEWLENAAYLRPERDTVIEVGANLGTTTVPLARETGLRILAIEADPRNFDYLQRNVALNALDSQVISVNAAVTDHPGPVAIMSDAQNWGASHVQSVDELPEQHTQVQVAGDTLDGVVTTHGFDPARVAFVWSDTEGHEPKVIKNGTMLWQAGVPLWAEVNIERLRRYGSEHDFTEAAQSHFKGFISSTDLLQHGRNAHPRAIAELSDFVALRRDSEEATDVLLLPA